METVELLRRVPVDQTQYGAEGATGIPCVSPIVQTLPNGRTMVKMATSSQQVATAEQKIEAKNDEWLAQHVGHSLEERADWDEEEAPERDQRMIDTWKDAVRFSLLFCHCFGTVLRLIWAYFRRTGVLGDCTRTALQSSSRGGDNNVRLHPPALPSLLKMMDFIQKMRALYTYRIRCVPVPAKIRIFSECSNSLTCFASAQGQLHCASCA